MHKTTAINSLKSTNALEKYDQVTGQDIFPSHQDLLISLCFSINKRLDKHTETVTKKSEKQIENLNFPLKREKTSKQSDIFPKLCSD